MRIDILLQPAIYAALVGVFFKYALDRFDGVRKERQGTKGLAFVCWYGTIPRPLNFPLWVANVVSRIRSCLRRETNQTQNASIKRKAVAFIFNSGRVPLTNDDLFMSKPLKLILSGDGELLDVAIRLESDQMVGIKLAGNRTIFRKPPNYRTERSITFSYMAPGHGLVLDIEYSANAPITFSISGPVNGMKNAVQQQILFDVDIENSRRLRRQRLAETLKLWLGGLMMASSTVFMVFDASTGGHAISSRGWTYWLTMGVMAIGEWLAIVAWHRLKQPKKVPATLRYWEPATKTRPIPIIDRATAE